MSRKTIVFIPGGPGLSAKTFDVFLAPHLENHFNLAFYNPLGTGNNLSDETPTYQAILEDLSGFVEEIKSDIILFGHSFGGIWATDLASSEKNPRIKGLVVLSTPFSKYAYNAINATFSANLENQGKKAMEKFLKESTNQNFKNYLTGCKKIYFNKTPPEGLKAIEQDPCNVDIFIHARIEGERKAHLLDKPINLQEDFHGRGEKRIFFPLNDCKKEARKRKISFYKYNRSRAFCLSR